MSTEDHVPYTYVFLALIISTSHSSGQADKHKKLLSHNLQSLKQSWCLIFVHCFQMLKTLSLPLLNWEFWVALKGKKGSSYCPWSRPEARRGWTMCHSHKDSKSPNEDRVFLLLIWHYLHSSFPQWMVSHGPQSQHIDSKCTGEEKKLTISSFLWIFSSPLALPIKQEWCLEVASGSVSICCFSFLLPPAGKQGDYEAFS